MQLQPWDTLSNYRIHVFVKGFAERNHDDFTRIQKLFQAQGKRNCA
jgi:hypothetical protein